MLKFIFSLLFLILAPIFNANAECSLPSENDGIKVGIIGDSFFMYESESCHSWQNFISERFDTKNVVNAAVSGSTISDSRVHGADKWFINQELPFKPDLLIIGGSGNDFTAVRDSSCKKNYSCLKKILDQIISEDTNSGRLIDIINKHSDPNTKIFWTYIDEASIWGPQQYKDIVGTGIVKSLYERLHKLSEKNKNFEVFNVSSIINSSDKKDWLEDGFHPSGFATFKATPILKSRYDGNIDSFPIENILVNNQILQTCDYTIQKRGKNAEGKSLDLRLSRGTLEIIKNNLIDFNTINIKDNFSKKGQDINNLINVYSYLELKRDNSLIGNLANYTAPKNFGNEDSINEFYSSTKLFNDLGLSYKGKEYELLQVFASKYNDGEYQILYIGNCKES
jgi:lysophospholipase L1-like esterase